MKNSLLFATFTAALLLSSTGCSQQQKDATQTKADQADDKTSTAVDKATDQAKDATHQAGQDLSNAGLTTKVKSKLAADVKLSTITSIDVDSSGSVVTLNGHVPTSADKKAAEQVASSVEGVTKVTNNLTVAP